MRRARDTVADISVIIPTLNESAEIAACLRAAWMSRPREVIVVDGGSHDDTVRQAKDLAATVLGTRPGRAIQLNAGAAAARGEILLFLHADCRLHPNCLAQVVQLLERPRHGENRHLCGAFRQRIDDPRSVFRWIEQGNALRARMGLPYGDQGIFLDRELFESVGRFAELPIMEDVDLMWRIRRYLRPQLLDGPLQVSARRWKENGVFRQTARNWLMVAAWSLGVPPSQLARYYAPHGALSGTASSHR